ncbi:helix-turn-helix domain-containing protein [Streptomyces sp. MMS24-I29]|uniref:AlbA family DNA-binding domain-containing protein n=1 Tax=Streptomyces sp. MMS24-I29 TaxID=3351480 RepID=UPI003C7CBF5C
MESLTLEYKSEYSATLVTTIAAMANTYGGMILVGINDEVEPGVERVVGVDAQATIDQIVSGCSTMLDPPGSRLSSMCPFGDGSGRSVVVVRVDANVAPRPVLVKLKAPIPAERTQRYCRPLPTSPARPRGTVRNSAAHGAERHVPEPGQGQRGHR